MYSHEDLKLTVNNDFFLYIIPFYQCNLRCQYCFVPKDITDIISDDTISLIPEFLSKHITSKRIQIGILWWEPFVNKKVLFSILKKLALNIDHTNFSFYISTNGILLDRTVLKEIKNINAHIELAFSIDWDIENLSYNRLGKQRLIAKRILQNYHNAVEILGRQNVSITQTVSLDTVKDFEKDLKFLVWLNPYLIRYRLAVGSLWTREKIEQYVAWMKNLYFKYIIERQKKDTNKLPIIEQFDRLYELSLKPEFFPCSKWANLTLLPNWYFVPCYWFLSESDQKTHRFNYPIEDLVKNNTHTDEFSQWRLDGYNLSNNINENGEKKKIFANFQKCLNGTNTEENLKIIYDAFDYKHQLEIKIWKSAFSIISKYNQQKTI